MISIFVKKLKPAAVFSRFTLAKILRKSNSQLADAITLMSQALKAGLPLAQAMEMAATEFDAPLGPEFKNAVVQMKLGHTAEEALEILSEKIPTEETALLAQSVSILRRTGGNLSQTFDTLATTIAERHHIEERIRILTSQGIYQGIFLLLMPWFLGLILHIVSPEYLSPLFETRFGLLLAAFGILLEAMGALWLWKIVMIKV